MTPAQFQEALGLLETAADIALPLAGHAELVPIANSAAILVQKIAAVVAQHSDETQAAAVMQAARVAADVAENLKFPVK